MPQAEIQIRRTVTITREEDVTVNVDIPQNILDDPDADFAVDDWVEGQLKIHNSALSAAVLGNWDLTDEYEDYEIDEVNCMEETG